ncbi:hypothetical protein IBB47_02090 [Listeria seeligeri]|uniref:hypothetical protein n=1 Tax=Listeria seeligeri TaxID=1640 RepID=UPI001886E727|nr:hypothetical protein [Listeria seeligeri]MBF2623700.1 hypothetical protein [Listeria seeligeri]
MITNDDFNFMQSAREEMLAGRKFEVELLIETPNSVDPDTGEPLDPQTDSKLVSAHVTENAGKQVEINDGNLSKSADIKVDISIEEWTPVTFFNYAQKKYKVIGTPQKGIGQRNRVEVLGELVH